MIFDNRALTSAEDGRSDLAKHSANTGALDALVVSPGLQLAKAMALDSIENLATIEDQPTSRS